MNANQSLGNIRVMDLARAGEGLTQWRSMALGFLTLLAVGVVYALAAWLAGAIGGIVGVVVFLVMLLVALVVLMTGISAVGVMLMDKAKNEPVRSMGQAVTFGLTCVPKALLLMVLVLAVVVVFAIVAAVLYFVCKIPVLGAVLAFVIHPILVLVAAVAFIALTWVINPLFMPALWSGMGFKAALGNVLLIARTRLIHVVLLQVVLYFILFVIWMLVFSGFFPASVFLTGMAAGIIGGQGTIMGAAMGGGIGALAGSSGLVGLFAGMGVLYCVLGALMVQVMIMGTNLIYLQVREGLDASGAEDALDGLVGDMRKRAEQAKDLAVAAAEQARERAAAASEQFKQSRAAKAQEAAAAAQEPAQQPPAAGQATAPEQAALDLAQRQAEEAARQEAARLEAARQEAAQQEAARLERLRQQLQAENEARAKAEAEARARAQEQARIDAAAAAAAAKPADPPSCPGCHAVVTAGDMFCGNCGHKLK